MLLPELDKYKTTHNSKTFLKNTFGCKDMAEQALKDYNDGKIKSITLIGLCTDICIISNALLLKSYMPDLTIYVDSSCCAGTSPEMHQSALDTMLCCQIYAY